MTPLSNTQTITGTGAQPWTSMKWGSSNSGGGGNRTFQLTQNGTGAVAGSIDFSNDGVNVAATQALSGLSAAGATYGFVQTANWAWFRYNITSNTATSVTGSAFGA